MIWRSIPHNKTCDTLGLRSSDRAGRCAGPAQSHQVGQPGLRV